MSVAISWSGFLSNNASISALMIATIFSNSLVLSAKGVTATSLFRWAKLSVLFWLAFSELVTISLHLVDKAASIY